MSELHLEHQVSSWSGYLVLEVLTVVAGVSSVDQAKARIQHREATDRVHESLAQYVCPSCSPGVTGNTTGMI